MRVEFKVEKEMILMEKISITRFHERYNTIPTTYCLERIPEYG